MKKRVLMIVLGCLASARLPAAAQDVVRVEASPPRGLSVMVYDTGRALITERRRAVLAAGLNEVVFGGLPPQIDPLAMTLFTVRHDPGLEYMEQYYLNVLESPETLFSRYLGIPLQVMTDGETFTGELQRVPPERDPDGTRFFIFRIKDGSLRHVPASHLRGIRFPPDVEGVRLDPTLLCRIRAAAEGPRDLRLSYEMDGLSWKASYEMILEPDASAALLSARIGLYNESDAEIDSARIKLVSTERGRAADRGSGDTRRRYAYGENRARGESSIAGLSPVMTYAAPRRIALPARSRTFVSYLSALEVPVEYTYVYDGVVFERFQRYRRNDWNYGTEYHSDVEQYVTFENAERVGLGRDLPEGRFRMIQRLSDEEITILGTGRLPATGAGTDAVVRLGSARGLQGKRERVGYREITPLHEYEESFAIRLTNHTDREVLIRVIEHLYRWHEYRIVKTDTEYIESEPQTVVFEPVLKPGAEKTIHYTVRYSW